MVESDSSTGSRLREWYEMIIVIVNTPAPNISGILYILICI